MGRRTSQPSQDEPGLKEVRHVKHIYVVVITSTMQAYTSTMNM